MISSGMSALARWMCSAWGRISLLGEAVEGLAHQLEVRIEVPRALDAGQAGQAVRVAVGGHEVRQPAQSSPVPAPHGRSRPTTLPARSATTSATKAQAMARLVVAPLRRRRASARAVRHGRGGMGEVVGDDLVRRRRRRSSRTAAARAVDDDAGDASTASTAARRSGGRSAWGRDPTGSCHRRA